MKNKAFCVHGHFYQPPREDPITGEIPLEPDASPFRNWNERIHDQCYKPNAALGNFERISFDLGPTLVTWMEEYDRKTLTSIIEQEQRNFEHFGVGNAMAQAYSHTILPLASRQDKITQIRWGITAFENTFSHKPAGMWLPETAVDMETLEILAAHGIEFTILAPWQVKEENVDISKPYWVKLPNKARITVILYDRPLSDDVSFHPDATANADKFIQERLLPRFHFSPERESEPEFFCIASDGEAYGHHQPFRDKFLERLTKSAVFNESFEITYPGIWLKQFVPTKNVHIIENTSWSCHHGVVRWSGLCFCTPHGDWKEPLRNALNSLAEDIDAVFLNVVQPLLEDPWELRHDYTQVLCEHSTVEEYIRSKISQPLGDKEVHKIALLLSAQYERQRMFTSCGWFFDDFDRIEPRNNIAYAAQAVFLTYKASGIDLTNETADNLKLVKSWRSGLSADVVFLHHLERARSLIG